MPFGNLKLNDGNEIPAIAFGTGTALLRQDASELVEHALENGFSHIDTAALYENEDSVGTGIRDTGLKRDDFYITTKYGGGPIHESMETSLKKLGLKQVDLYLLHHPRLVGKGEMESTWREFERIKKEGLAKSIGVSNFMVDNMKELLKIANIKPAVNQISLNPYNWSSMKDIVKFSNEHGIVTEAYSSLVPITKTPGGPLDPVLKTIGVRLGASPAQVIFAWLKSKGIVIVTTSSRKDRLKEYLDVADLPSLTDAEIAAIEAAGAKGPPTRFFRGSARALATRVACLGALALYFSARFLMGRK